MPKLTLLVYLRDDTLNTLEQRIDRMQCEPNSPKISELSGVTLLAHNAILFDETLAHRAYIQLCSSLLAAGLPYLCVPIPSTGDCLAAGKLSKELAESLKTIGVPLV